MRTVRPSVNRTSTATISTTITATTSTPLVDERRRALDLDDFDLGSGLEHLIGHVGARRPLLAADAHASAGLVDALQHRRLRAGQRSSAGTKRRRHVDVCARERPQEAERCERGACEDEQLQPIRCTRDRRHRPDNRGKRNGAEKEEAGREDLTDGQQQRCDRPGEPRCHMSQSKPRRNIEEPTRHVRVTPRRGGLCMAKTDAELLRKDASGFRELYGRYAERVNGYHLRRCGSRDAAHDLTAETFAQAWFARRRVHDEAGGSAAPWLFGIARNVLLESVRRGRIEREAATRLGVFERLDREPAAVEPDEG